MEFLIFYITVSVAIVVAGEMLKGVKRSKTEEASKGKLKLASYFAFLLVCVIASPIYFGFVVYGHKQYKKGI